MFLLLEREQLWHHVILESIRITKAWVLMGDYNNALSPLDKDEGLPIPFQ